MRVAQVGRQDLEPKRSRLARLRRSTNALTLAYLCFAGVTWTFGEPGVGAAGRVTIADLIGVLLVGRLLIDRLLAGKHVLPRMPKQYRLYLPLLGVFLVGAALASRPGLGFLEWLIHAFIFVVSLTLFLLYCSSGDAENLRTFLMMALYSGSGVALLGLVDFFLWPSLLPGTSSGLTGTFRNTGQAGAFFGAYWAFLLPSIISGLVKRSVANVGLLVSIGMAMVFTAKRAALVGTAVGLVLLALSLAVSRSAREKKYGLTALLVLAIVVPIGYLSFQWGIENIEGMAWRYAKKFNERTVEDFEEGFLAENLAATRMAFEINPVIGVGLGNVAGILTAKYEIHSTYLAIIGNSGLLGVLAYTVFLAGLFRRVASYRPGNEYEQYFRYFLPLLVGLAVSWAYTYHLRKREFWIMFAVVALVKQAQLASRRGDSRTPGN